MAVPDNLRSLVVHAPRAGERTAVAAGGVRATGTVEAYVLGGCQVRLDGTGQKVVVPVAWLEVEEGGG